MDGPLRFQAARPRKGTLGLFFRDTDVGKDLNRSAGFSAAQVTKEKARAQRGLLIQMIGMIVMLLLERSTGL